jgi:hypothetical protein
MALFAPKLPMIIPPTQQNNTKQKEKKETIIPCCSYVIPSSVFISG